MADVDIAATASLVGLVTFLMGFGGVMLGRAAGPLLGRRAELVGGLGLIVVGTKILVEHTLL
jgi:manganese efflux pump family protein